MKEASGLHFTHQLSVCLVNIIIRFKYSVADMRLHTPGGNCGQHLLSPAWCGTHISEGSIYSVFGGLLTTSKMK